MWQALILMALSHLHREMLAEGSGIPEALIAMRGYFTAEKPKELESLGFSKEQAKHVPALVIPLHGVDGEIVGYQSRPDTPREDDHGKQIKYETPAGWSMRIDVCPIAHKDINDKKVPLWITEGVKKGDAGCARGMCVVDLIGVWNWRGKNDKDSTVELADWDRIAIKGRIIYIVFDSDVMEKPEVKLALKRLAGMLKRRGAAQVIPVVPPVKSGYKKAGLDDYLVRGGTSMELIRSADLSLLASQREIVINNRNLDEVAAEGLAALREDNIPPKLFVRSGDLVKVVTDERGIASIKSVTLSALRGLLSRSAVWVRKTKDGGTVMFPPKDVCEDILATDNWPEFPPVVAITRAPVLSPKYTISSSPGYCPDSHYYIASDSAWPQWKGDVQSAVSYIFDEILTDFPFVGEADRANALALMLLPIVRPAIAGPTPLHLVDAPVQGAGKGKLAKACLAPTAGSDIAVTTIGRDESELRKKITSSLLDGRPYIFMDNLTNKVDSDSLSATLTSNEWYDRELNFSRNVNLPIRCVWVATGNNAELSKDIVRRSVWIRIDPNCENPGERKGFKHPNIEGFIVDNRLIIVSALSKIVTHWIAQGSPEYSGTLVGSYEDYCKVLGGILETAGVPGFWENRDLLRDNADGESAAWSGFVERWAAGFGGQFVASKELLEAFDKDEELAVKLGDKGEVSRTAKLSQLLKKKIGAVLSGYKILRERDSHTKAFKYRLLGMDPQTSANLDQTSATSGQTSASFDFEIEPEKVDSAEVAEVAEVSLHAHDARETRTTHDPGAERQIPPNVPQPPQTDLDDDEVIL